MLLLCMCVLSCACYSVVFIYAATNNPACACSSCASACLHHSVQCCGCVDSAVDIQLMAVQLDRGQHVDICIVSQRMQTLATLLTTWGCACCFAYSLQHAIWTVLCTWVLELTADPLNCFLVQPRAKQLLPPLLEILTSALFAFKVCAVLSLVCTTVLCALSENSV